MGIMRNSPVLVQYEVVGETKKVSIDSAAAAGEISSKELFDNRRAHTRNQGKATSVDELISSLQRKLIEVSPSPTRACIFKAPIALRKVHEDAYTPQVVSIGPYHHGDERLKDMEEHKMRYLSDFFRRGPKSDLEVFVNHLRELEKYARMCYGPSIKDERDVFVEMMLLDGCFVLELFFKYTEKYPKDMQNDPLFHISSMIPAIRVDMLLLENQLPLFVLRHLFNLFNGDQPLIPPVNSFRGHTLNFFNFKNLLSMTEEVHLFHDSTVTVHFLDLLRECFIRTEPIILPLSHDHDHSQFIPSATELKKAGVKFRKSTKNNIFGLNFIQGILEMPVLIVGDSTEVLFRNLIAFEQCAKTSRNQYITHYLALMDFLINSPDDVATLRRAGIVENWLGDDEQVSEIFNKIFKGVTVFAGSFYFKDVTEKVNAYHKTPWHLFRAMLGRDYFYSPWSTASSIAVIIVVLCTIVQAVGTVFSIVKGK